MPLRWRSSSLTKLNISNSFTRRNSLLESVPSTRNSDSVTPDDSSVDSFDKNSPKPEAVVRKDKGPGNTIVTVVVVEAKDLPDAPDDDSSSQGIYCRFRLGGEAYRTKTVLKSRRPQWRERFKLNLCCDHLLKITLFHKGKQKSFMGRCVLDLSHYQRERTHDVWLTLDEGYGSVHLSVTMCNTRNDDVADVFMPDMDEIRHKYVFYNLCPDLEVIGQLVVKVIGAKGLQGKPNAYCSLELDNERVRTPSVPSSGEPTWNKTFVFNVYDVTSVLELKVMDSSLHALLGEFLGRVTIPLLRIAEGEARWYALKDAAKRKGAKGNSPRINLEMSMAWNPLTASLKLFQPKRVKYMEKPPKFDLGLVYKNLKFIRDTLNILKEINEVYKRMFEWEDREYASLCLFSWIAICCTFSPWTTPLLLLVPFIVGWYLDQKRKYDLTISLELPSLREEEHEDSLAQKIQGLPAMTFTITDGIEYIVSVAERLLNLVTFKVPFLSYLTMVMLVGSSVVFYYVPLRYLLITLAVYKFGRKQLNPGRVLNNDLLDFISRIPDDKILKDWRELSVPEPTLERRSATTPTPSTSPPAIS